MEAYLDTKKKLQSTILQNEETLKQWEDRHKEFEENREAFEKEYNEVKIKLAESENNLKIAVLEIVAQKKRIEKLK